MIVLPFCGSERLPNPNDVEAFGEEDAMIRDGRLLYVGVTRAKTWLIITYSDHITRLLPREQSLYARVKV